MILINVRHLTDEPSATLIHGSMTRCNTKKGRHILCFSLITIFLGIFVTGCASSKTKKTRPVPEDELSKATRNKPKELHPQIEALLREGERNAVLNYNELGLQAMEMGNYDLAGFYFNQSIYRLSNVISSNRRAKKARSLFESEDYKKFRGEPYERAMVFYYRGLLDLKEGNYENARASFKNGITMDVATKEQNITDFSLLIFLAGWASQCISDDMLKKSSYEELKKHEPDFNLPQEDQNTLFVVETGKGPRKVAAEEGGAKLQYERSGKEMVKSVTVRFSDKKSIDLYEMADLYYQASTRGGRPVSDILTGQAEYKVIQRKTADKKAFGPGQADISHYRAHRMMSKRVESEVDTRTWTSLPQKVYINTCHLSAGEHRFRLNIQGNKNTSRIRKKVRKIKGKPKIIWLKINNL